MHGRPRNQTIDEKKKQILKEKIEVFSALKDKLLVSKQQQVYTRETLSKIETALTISPELYSMWNYRKEIINHLLEEEDIKESKEKQIEIFEQELKLTESILSGKHLKSYGTWHHRRWIMLKLDSSYWEKDLKLTSLLLSYDNRNCKFTYGLLGSM